MPRLDARKERWARFYAEGDPLSHILLICFETDWEGIPLPHREKKQARVEWAWNAYEAQTKRTEWLDDDSLPYLNVYTGTEIFAEAFGCQVHRPDDNMPFALPLIHSASDVSRIKVPDLDTPPIALLFTMADELRRRAGPDALLRMVDIQSPLGISALICEKTAFYTALIEDPDALLELSGKVMAFLTAFLDEWFSRYGVGFIAHYPVYYMSQGVTLSEDEIGAVSMESFRLLFLPQLKQLSERYGGIGIHCCANARHQWDALSSVPDLKLLNLVQPKDVLREAYSFFAARVPQMHSWCGDGDPVGWLGRLPSDARVVLQVDAENEDHARKLSEQMRAVIAPGAA